MNFYRMFFDDEKKIFSNYLEYDFFVCIEKVLWL